MRACQTLSCINFTGMIVTKKKRKSSHLLLGNLQWGSSVVPPKPGSLSSMPLSRSCVWPTPPPPVCHLIQITLFWIIIFIPRGSWGPQVGILCQEAVQAGRGLQPPARARPSCSCPGEQDHSLQEILGCTSPSARDMCHSPSTFWLQDCLLSAATNKWQQSCDFQEVYCRFLLPSYASLLFQKSAVSSCPLPRHGAWTSAGRLDGKLPTFTV